MNSQELWQVKIDNHVYTANFDEIAKKIRKGMILRQDKIKSENLSWTDVGDITEFEQVFDEELLNINLSIENSVSPDVYTHFQVEHVTQNVFGETVSLTKCCAIHSELPPFYVCTICENLFCKTCPPSNEKSQPICLFCGGICVVYSARLWTMEQRKEQIYNNLDETIEEKIVEEEIEYAKLVAADFKAALIYPVRFPLSLSIGSILFSILTLGVIVTAFRGGWTLLVTLILTTVILTLKFGVLSKTVENITQQNFKNGFIPRLRKYMIWEDFVNPFFTGLGVYIVSFGLFFFMAIALGLYAWFSFAGDVKTIEAEMLKSGDHLNLVINSTESEQQIQQVSENELRAMISNTKLRQYEAVFGNNHLVDDKQLEKLAKSVMRLTIYLQVPVFLAFILGVLIFPAICLTVGDTRAVSKIRFTVGFKAMRKLGFDYLKILMMCLVFLAVSMVAIKGLDAGFSNLELPIAGVFSAIIVGSFLIFYFWTVFSALLGIIISKKV